MRKDEKAEVCCRDNRRKNNKDAKQEKSRSGDHPTLGQTSELEM